MAARLLAAAFLFSLLVPLGEALSAVPLARGSLAALALLPWLILAPLPRSRSDTPGPAWRGPLFSCCLALPPLGLGAGVDLARGVAPGVLATTAVAAWLVLALWSWAAEGAARSSRARRVFAVLWFALLPGATALRCALAWVPLRVGGGEDRAALFALDPLVWCHRWGRAGGLGELDLGHLFLAPCAALLVLVVVLALARDAVVEPGP